MTVQEEKHYTSDEVMENIRRHQDERKAKTTKLYQELMALLSNDAFYTADHKINDHFFYRVFTYRLASYSDFLLPSAMEARGIMFKVAYADESVPLELTCRPPQKFFNIGENPLTLDLDYSKVIGSYIKEDGSLISSYTVRDIGMGEDFESQVWVELKFKSKTSISSDQAIAAQKWVETQPELKEAIMEMEYYGYTVNCEWCAPDNRIVVGYMEPKLIVLNARHRFSGEYADRHMMTQMFGDYLVGTATQVTCEQDLKPLKAHTGYEGLILQFEEGYKVEFAKFKNDWYLHRHRTKDSVNNANALFDCVLNEGSDDLRTMFLDDPLATKIIDDMEALVIPLYNRLVKGCQTFYEENKHLERKEFAIKGQLPIFEEGNPLNKMAFGLIMTQYIGKVPDYKGTLSKHKKTWTKVEDDA